MNKLIIALLLSISSVSYAADSGIQNDDKSTVSNSYDPQVKEQKDLVNKNKNKSKAENAKRIKSKDKGMHIKDDVTDTKQNEPGDAEDLNLPIENSK